MNNLIQKLSHQNLPFNISVYQATLLLSIKYFQLLAVLLPSYQENNYETPLLYSENLIKSILIIPYAFNFTLILLCMLFSILKTLLFIIFCLVESKSPQIKLKLGVKYLFFDILIFQQIITIPEIYLFLNMISQDNKKIVFQTFKFELIAPICILQLIIQSIITFTRVYFIRAQNTIQFTRLFPKFTYLSLFRITLKFFIIIISNQQSYPVQILKNIFGLLVFFICYLELYVEKIFEPQINRYLFQFITSLIFTQTIYFITFLTKNDQKQAFYFIILGLPIIITLTKMFNQKNTIDILIENQDNYPLILFIEQLYEVLEKIEEKKQQNKYEIIKNQIYIKHRKICQACNVDINYQIQQLIQCSIQKNIKSKEHIQQTEDLTIFYVFFLQNQMHQPLNAYVELKKFEFKKKKFSMYYKFIRSDLMQRLKEKIEDKQSHSKLKSQQNQTQQIEIKEIVQSFILEEQYLDQYISLIDEKIKIWNLQIKGMECLNDLKQALIKYGTKLNNTINNFEIDTQFDIKQKKLETKNIINLKLISILFSVLLNYNEKAQEFEEQIITICSNENNLPLDTICNASLVEDKVCVLSISMVKNRGKILNCNKKQVAKHFGFNFEDFHMINHINDIIPPFLVEVHDHLLEIYLETAQSQLFRQFVQIFSLQQQGLLQAKQLKLDNNFNYEDDYVITGCISKVKEGSEFILFDQSGKIISTTESIYHLMIQGIDQEQNSPIQTLNQCYIFFFFPEILKIFQNHKITNKSYLNLEIEDQTNLITRFNIIDFINKYQKSLTASSPFMHFQHDHKGSQYFQKSRTSIIHSESQSSFHKNQNQHKMILKNELQILTITYQRQVEEVLRRLNEGGEATYTVKFILQFKQMGTHLNNKSYFVMEILDFRSKEQLLSKRRKVSILNVHHNYIPRTSSRFKMESLRDDSRRLDQSSEQFIQSFALINQNELLEHENLSNKHKKSSDEQISSEKDNSSLSSSSSKSNSNKECHSFINSTKMITPLKINLFLILICSVIKLSYLILNIATIQNSTNQIVISNKNLNVPLIFNRQFFQIFSLKWLVFLNELNIINCSDYLINQTNYKLDNISQTTFENLNDLYSSIVVVENEQLLKNVSFRQLGGENEQVNFTYFMLYLETTIKELFSIKNQELILNLENIKKLMILRINLYNVFQVSKELINSFDTLYKENVNLQANKIEVFTLIYSIFIILIMIPKFIIWKKQEFCKRQIILMIGRLKESDARFSINKAIMIKEILENKDNTHNWRQINYSSFDGKNNHNDLKSQRGSQQTTKFQNRQTVVLNTRIQDISINKKVIVFILSLTFIVFMMFIVCGYILFRSEFQEMVPFQKMTVQFITFATNLDAMLSSGIITKSLPSVYSKLIQNNLIQQQMINNLESANNQLFALFVQSEVNFDANLTSIFEEIVLSQQITNDDKQTLQNIYKYDICQAYGIKVPFCQITEINIQFIQNYSYATESDDISIFYSNGINGVTSQLSQIIKQYFYFELTNLKYSNNLQENEEFMNSKEFNNGFIQHFIFTTQCIDIFISIIQYSNENFSQLNLQKIELYYCLSGSILILLYTIIYLRWIHYNHQQIKYLKLGLSLLPQQIMNDPYIMNTIKQLN